jgi:NADPH:quinone reductase-like Zn-dependent oxidoreductase
VRAVQYDRYGGPDVLSMATLPSPTCGAGEALIEVHAASVNPIDWKIRSGLLKPLPSGFPAPTGRDGAGIVRDVGEGGPRELIGSRVCFVAPRGQGTWAEEIVVPASLLVPIPGSLPFTQAAALPLAGISAWIGLVETAAILPGTRVLIHAGAGGVGGMAVQLAHHLGASVAATCSARNADYVRSLGASEVVAYDRMPFEGRLRDMDVVFDLLGGDIHRRSYTVLKRGGRLVYLNAEPIEDRGPDFGVEVRMAQIVPSRAALASIVNLVAEGALRPHPEMVLPFERFADAQSLSEQGHGRGKIVLQLR